MADHWWRASDGSIDHPKLLKLSDAMHRAWFTLMCIASANGGSLPPLEDIALRLREKPARIATWIAHLVAGELFDNDGGIFKPHNWDKRQYKTDAADMTNAERQKNFRKRQREDLKALIALRDGVRNEPLRNGVTAVMAKRPDTDTDITPTVSEDTGRSKLSISTEAVSTLRRV